MWVDYTNFLVNVELMCVWDLKSSPSLHEDIEN